MQGEATIASQVAKRMLLSTALRFRAAIGWRVCLTSEYESAGSYRWHSGRSPYSIWLASAPPKTPRRTPPRLARIRTRNLRMGFSHLRGIPPHPAKPPTPYPLQARSRPGIPSRAAPGLRISGHGPRHFRPSQLAAPRFRGSQRPARRRRIQPIGARLWIMGPGRRITRSPWATRQAACCLAALLPKASTRRHLRRNGRGCQAESGRAPAP
jgi:hypothetical protein